MNIINNERRADAEMKYLKIKKFNYSQRIYGRIVKNSF